MRKRLFLAVISFLLFSAFLLNNQSVFADNSNRTSQNITLSRNQTINKDYFASDDNIILSGTVNGDAYLSGGNIIVDGTINGDLIAFGGSITIKGNIRDDVRAAAGNITISGSVGKNITLGAGSINLTNTARIDGSIVAGGGNVEISAPTAKGAKLGAGQITISNSIGGDVDAGANQILLTQGARINGSLNYWSSTKAEIQSGAVVTGKVNQNIPPRQPDKRDVADIITRAAIIWKIISLFSYFAVGLILLKFAPIHTQRKLEIINKKPWISLGIGFLAIILSPFIFIFLLITIIGIPIAFILLAVFLILAYISIVFFSMWIGRIVFNSLGSKNKTIWPLLVGLMIYEIFTLIPFIGWLISLIALFIGLGAILLAEKSLYQDARAKKMI